MCAEMGASYLGYLRPACVLLLGRGWGFQRGFRESSVNVNSGRDHMFEHPSDMPCLCALRETQNVVLGLQIAVSLHRCRLDRSGGA